MSSTVIFSKLSSPLRELLVGSAQQDQQQLGVSEKDKEDIAKWIDKVAQANFVKSDAFQVIGVLYMSALLYQQLPVARCSPCPAHVPRQQLFDGCRRCGLRRAATRIRTSHYLSQYLDVTLR